MNQQDKRDLTSVVVGIIIGISLAVATVVIVNERRFSDKCDKVGGVVVSHGTLGKDYCISPDALNKEGK
jgi:hypothetical protein